MTDAIDASTIKAQRHLFAMMARGIDGDSICADMEPLGWPCQRVLDTVHALLKGVMIGPSMTPTQRALIILCGRAEENAKALGGFTLGGRHASTIEVIRAANVVLTNFDMPMIDYPGLGKS